MSRVATAADTTTDITNSIQTKNVTNPPPPFHFFYETI